MKDLLEQNVFAEKIAKGISKISYGKPEEFTPESFRKTEMKLDELNELEISKASKISEKDISWKVTARGITISIPMDTDEDIYGFGLQLQSVNHAGRRRLIKVNSDPVADTGESHAPVPFYITTAGYGLFVNTLRYATFFMGTHADKGISRNLTNENEVHEEFSESALYALKRAKENRKIIIEIPHVKGVELFLFEGSIMEIVQRYNLFSGGGCVPPMWGLGVWYRSYGGSTDQDVLRLADSFRQESIPVDVVGLEPGWHSHSYSCTYKWSNLFTNHENMVKKLNEDGYKINLWEHTYVHPMAPFYKELMPYAGNLEVWNGLVPDFAMDEAVKLFSDYHRDNFVRQGIAGFKLDECDNSDYNPSNWAFPESTEFPSGMDGEQMHSVIGVLYQNLIYDIYKKENRRTFSQVRSSGALASPLPFVLYSDLYDHKQFIKGVVNAGFSGLLWCPEVRDCADGNDLLRRLQTIVFSAHALVNSWRIPSPPWKQTDIVKNLAGEEMDTAAYYTTETRKLFELRMQLLPYLYSAFVQYAKTGKPPIRALVMDYQGDANVNDIGNQYLFGDSMMVCPLTYEDGTERSIYFPEGEWYHFVTKEKISGGQRILVKADYTEIPVYVKSNSIIPLAEPVQYVDENTVFNIMVASYGTGDASFTLYEDDFYTFGYEKNCREIVLAKKDGRLFVQKKEQNGESRYRIIGEV